MTLKDKCKAIIALDRAELAVDDARGNLARVATAAEPTAPVWSRYIDAMCSLAKARIQLDRLKEG